MKNPNNHGSLFGFLKSDPKITNNSDGSKRVQLLLDVKDQETDRIMQIPCHAFLSKTCKASGPYGYLHQGEAVEIEYYLKFNGCGLTLQIETITFGKALYQNTMSSDNSHTPQANLDSTTEIPSAEEIQATDDPQLPPDNIPDFGDELDF